MERDIRGALNKVDGSAAGRKVGDQFSNSLGASTKQGIGKASGGIRASINEMVSGITAQFGKAGAGFDSAFQAIPTKAAFAATAVAGIGAAAVIVGKQLYDLGAQWDEVVDTAAGRTGLLGDGLKDLTNSIKETANATASSIPEIGDIAARVTQSLHLTGQPLQDMTKTIANLNALTGEQLNVRELGKAYRAFGVDVGDQVPQLDALWNASTTTGIPVNELVAAVSKGGPALREFGLDLGESAALVATFEDAGLDADGAINGLRVALKNFAAAGLEPQEALRATITEIKNLSDAGNTAAAVDLAAKTFGKGFAPFLESIKTGKVDVDSLNNSLRQVGPDGAASINQARDATSDWQEQLTILKNQLSTEVEPAASGLFSSINVMLDQYVVRPFREANDLVQAFKNLMNDPAITSGPATLDAEGNMVPTAAPTPAANPLEVIAAPPSSGNRTGPQNPLDVFIPIPRRAGGGPIRGAGGPKADRIPAWLSNGEHVLTAKDVLAMGGQAGVYAFRNALHRATGGAMKLAQVIPDLRRRKKAGRTPGTIGLPDWTTPGQGWGPPPPDWWLKPVDPDSILFPDFWGQEPWGKHPLDKDRFRPFGFSGGGAAVRGPFDALRFAQSVSGSGYGWGGTGPKVWDCSGFMSDIYAILTGKPYQGSERYFTTEADFEALGFIRGYNPNSAFNIGVNASQGGSSHMAGTLMGYNVESGGSGGGPRFGEGASGATDFAEQYHLPIPLSDMAVTNGADITRAYADSLTEGGQDAAQSLEQNQANRGMDGESLGQSIVSGMLQTIGLDGSLFSNPFEWPNVKSGMALANWGAGMLGLGGEGGGMIPGIPSLGQLLRPGGPGSTVPQQHPDAAHRGTGAPPGPQFVINGDVGMDPRALTQRFDAGFNAAWRRNMPAVRPGNR